MVLVAFAALMAVHFAVTFAFPGADLITHLLLAGVAAASLVVGLVALTLRGDGGAPVAAPELSFATALLALGVAAVVVGAMAGRWLVLIGAGMAAFGVAGLVREGR